MPLSQEIVCIENILSEGTFSRREIFESVKDELESVENILSEYVSSIDEEGKRYLRFIFGSDANAFNGGEILDFLLFDESTETFSIQGWYPVTLSRIPTATDSSGTLFPLSVKKKSRLYLDPEGWLKENKYAFKHLDIVLEIAKFEYFTLGNTTLPDHVYDAFEYLLRKEVRSAKRKVSRAQAAREDNILNGVGFAVSSSDSREGNRKKYNYFSERSISISPTEKVKPTDRSFTEWLKCVQTTPGVRKIIASDKLDGVSVVLQYSLETSVALETSSSSYRIEKIYTRGDGESGLDITEKVLTGVRGVVKTLVSNSTPNSTPESRVENKFYRAELCISRKNFMTSGLNELYSSPRVACSSYVNSGGFVLSEFSKYFEVQYFSKIFPGGGEREISRFDDDPVVNSGAVIPFTREFDASAKGLPTALLVYAIERREKTTENEEVSIDGIVLSVNTSTHSRESESVALKPQFEDQALLTEVLYLEWRPTKAGKYIPIAVCQKRYLPSIGKSMSRPFLANYVKAKRGHIGPGAQLTIVNKGDAIPQAEFTHTELNKARGIQVQLPPTPEECADLEARVEVDLIYPKDYIEAPYLKDSTSSNVESSRIELFAKDLCPRWRFAGKASQERKKGFIATAENAQDIVLVDPDNNRVVQIKRLIHFVEVMDIKKLGPVRVAKLYDTFTEDFKSRGGAHFYFMTEKEISTPKGLGKKVAKDVYKSIQNSIQASNLSRYISSLTPPTNPMSSGSGSSTSVLAAVGSHSKFISSLKYFKFFRGWPFFFFYFLTDNHREIVLDKVEDVISKKPVDVYCPGVEVIRSSFKFVTTVTTDTTGDALGAIYKSHFKAISGIGKVLFSTMSETLDTLANVFLQFVPENVAEKILQTYACDVMLEVAPELFVGDNIGRNFLSRKEKIEGKKFVLTNFKSDPKSLRKIKEQIFKYGGFVSASRVTEDIDFVINAIYTNITKKVRDAFALSVPVLSVSEFENYLE